MTGYLPAATGRWTNRIGGAVICLFAAGCFHESHIGRIGLAQSGSSGSSDACGIELADAIDQVERRNLARVRPANRAAAPPTDAASVATANRAVSPQEVAAAVRLVWHSDRIMQEVERAGSLLDGNQIRRERLSRSLAMRFGRSPGRLSVDAPLTLRTDFVNAADSDAAGVAYLTLSELAEAASESSDDTGAEGTSAPAKGAAVARGPLPGFRETVWRDIKRMPRELWHDTKRTFWNPTNAIILITAGGVSVALRPEVDDDIEDYYEDHHTMSKGWRDTFGVLGNPALHFVMAGGWYLAGQQMQSAKTYEVGKTLFSALIINGVSTSALKLAACTDSPNGEAFGWPSGHTSSAFTVAAVMHQAYGPLVGIPLYGVAGMVGLARLDDREHHFSDVVFGAALGLVVGHTVASGHRPQIFGGDLIPYADPTTGSGGIAWFKTMK